MKTIDLSDRRNMFYWQTNRPLSAVETQKVFMNRHGKISEETIRQIVAKGMSKAGFTGNDAEAENVSPIVKQGSVNTVVPVILKSGKKIILRIHPEGVKNGYFWVEKVATSLALKEGVPTYETIYIDDSQIDIPFDFMIMTHVNGVPMQTLKPLDQALEKKLVKETGRYAALIHKIKPPGFGFFLNDKAKQLNNLIGQYFSFKEHIYAALPIDLQFLVDHKVLDIDQNKRIEMLFVKSKALMVCKKGSLIHNDIADWNEITDGKSITGIMDWDECFSGDPMMELAAYNLFFGEPRISWYKEGYQEISNLENNEDKFQLFKLRYLISKMHLRTKRSEIDPSPILKQNIVRGMQAMQEVFNYFKL